MVPGIQIRWLYHQMHVSFYTEVGSYSFSAPLNNHMLSTVGNTHKAHSGPACQVLAVRLLPQSPLYCITSSFSIEPHRMMCNSATGSPVAIYISFGDTARTIKGNLAKAICVFA